MLSDSKTHCKVTLIKTGWYWYKDSNTDQWNRNTSPETDSCAQLIFNKHVRTTLWREKRVQKCSAQKVVKQKRDNTIDKGIMEINTFSKEVQIHNEVQHGRLAISDMQIQRVLSVYHKEDK